jgi:2-keto-4-pentenoate hydratase/2-oxohepta-3-ene-1,7-dioic acid hydratase in catechol pathway
MSPLGDLRLVSYETARGPRGGVVAGDTVHDLGDLLGAHTTSTLQALERWDEVRAELAALVPIGGDGIGKLGSVRLLTPVLYPRAMFCAGANYSDHVAEMARVLGLPDDGPRQEDDKPWHYVNLPEHTFVGPDAPFRLPSFSSKVDWEAEIGVVIGRAARNVPVAHAMQHVAGLTIVNDLSARDWVARPSVPIGSPFHWDWVSQKSWEDSNPVGPWIVPIESIPDAGRLGIKLWVNDVLMQDSNSKNLIFSIAEQIAHLSTRLTLRPGDLIATGTPAGVGMARGVFLKPGDDVRIWVQHIGELRNRAIAPSDVG